MMAHTITLIPGDGIGAGSDPGGARVCWKRSICRCAFSEADAGFGTFERRGNALPAETLRPVRAQ